MNKDKLEEKIRSIGWFPNYQSFSDLGIKGLRDSYGRFGFFNEDDIKGQTVIDYGCNLGQACVMVKKMGAGSVFGCDCQKEVIDIAKEIAIYLDFDIKYGVVDFNDKNFNTNVLKLNNNYYKSDIALFLSVYSTLELKDRDGLLKTILDNTERTVYFEGHNKEREEKYSKIFLQKRFNIKNFIFLGYLKDSDKKDASVRPFFILKHRDIIFRENVLKIINDKTSSNTEKMVIGIEGLAGSGKSTLLKFLMDNLPKDNFVFIDDLVDINNSKNLCIRHKKFPFLNWFDRNKNLLYLSDYIKNTDKHLIISDYRMREYISKADLLFNTEVDNETRLNRIKKRQQDGVKIPKSFIRGKKIYSKDFTCSSFYTVDMTNYEK